MSDKILVVEYDSDTQHMVAEMLRIAAYDCDVATNAGEALKLINEGDYEAAVIDIFLPGDKDGLGLLFDIRAAGLQLPCIAVTAYHTAERRVQCEGHGFDAYFPKLINRTQLITTLGRLTARSQM